MKDEIEKDVNAAKEIAIKEGREFGIAEDRKKGIAEGRAEGIAEGRAEGIAEGRTEGRNALVDAVMRLRKGESKEQLLSSGVDEDTIELAFTIK